MKKVDMLSKIESCQKNNQKFIILYKMLASDLIFYYTISYLFMINVKGLTTAQIVFADAFYPLFKLIFQIPTTIFISKIGKRNGLIVGNICVGLYILSVIGLINTSTLIIGNFFLALGFVIKGISESPLLYDSLEESPQRRELFSKYEGKSVAGYYLVDAVTALLSGFLFVINPYLPMCLSLLIVLITIILSFCLCEIPQLENDENIKEKENQTILAQFKTSLKNTKDGFKFILQSPRLHSLIFFSAMFSSILNLLVTLRRSLLDDVNVSAENFGIIFAIMGIIASIASSGSLALHRKYRNKTLGFLGILLTTSTIICGLVVYLNLPKFLLYYLLLIMIAIQYSIKGPYYTLIKQYLNSFSNSDMRLKIYSAQAFTEYLFSTIISMASSFILNYYTNAVTTLIIGCSSFILMLIVLKYMSTRVGLKPEEYTQKDIGFYF